ncbi:MAG: NAD-dependent epimerase/dehydratase family protein [Opitutae bacterium]|nr:NAD-dependent epimerase/dehydratase family protein [Opitutae bacterium]MCD8299090.1 NAD-dependent epimerase/dehydratase family protein [Opitutae bacterium]
MIREAVIIGGSGFLGNAIARRCLASGWKVRAVGRKNHPEFAAQGIDFARADIAKSPNDLAEIFAGADVVFHIAAKTDVWGKVKDFRATNITGTQNVIDACKKSGVKNLVYASTPSVVFNEREIDGGDEAMPYCTSKLSLYALTKAEAERKIRAANCAELRTIALRPHLIWGLGDPHLVPRIIEQAAQGRLRIIGDGKNMVDLTHVENAAHAHVLAAEILADGAKSVATGADIGGNAYFVSDGAPVKLWSWVNNLLRQIGAPALREDRSVPLKSAYFAGTLLEFFWKIFGVAGEPPITRFVASELARNHWFKISAARRDLGYAPVVDPAEKFTELINFYKGKS